MRRYSRTAFGLAFAFMAGAILGLGFIGATLILMEISK
jgi:hypothetical protein